MGLGVILGVMLGMTLGVMLGIALDFTVGVADGMRVLVAAVDAGAEVWVGVKYTHTRVGVAVTETVGDI